MAEVINAFLLVLNMSVFWSTPSMLIAPTAKVLAIRSRDRGIHWSTALTPPQGRLLQRAVLSGT
jgi:hypothetical protein